MTERERLQAFVVDLGVALYRHGATTPRVEEALMRLASRLGLEGHFFAMPTALLASFGRGGGQTHLVRLQGTIVDLEKLARLDALLTALLHGSTTPAEAEPILRDILALPGRRNARVLEIGAQVVTCAAAGRLIGGGVREVIVSGVIGMAGALLATFGTSQRWQRLQVPLAAFIAALVATGATTVTHPVSAQLAMIAGLVVFLPGLALTTSINELATGHLVAGTARFAAAILVFITLAVGVALGNQAATLGFGSATSSAPQPLPGWTLAVALVVSPVAISVLFSAPRRELPWVIVGSIVAYAGGALGQRLLGAELGVVLGGFAAGAAANGYARWRNRPSAIVYLPALILLVPGIIGFRSVTALAASDVTSGIEIAFTTLLIAASLVTGMLLAAVVVPPRRVL